MSDDDDTVGGRRKPPAHPESDYVVKLKAELAEARAKCMELQQTIKSRNLMIDGLLRWLSRAEEALQKTETKNPDVEIILPLGGGSGGAE